MEETYRDFKNVSNVYFVIRETKNEAFIFNDHTSYSRVILKSYLVHLIKIMFKIYQLFHPLHATGTLPHPLDNRNSKTYLGANKQDTAPLIH